MKIGILCAGDENCPILPLISNCKIRKAMLKFHAGQIDSVEVVVPCFSGRVLK